MSNTYLQLEGGGAIVLGELEDVTTTGAIVGQVLKWDGNQWAPANDLTSTGGTGATTLTALDDVALVTPVAGEYLYYNGTTWTDKAITKADISDFNGADYATASHVHAQYAASNHSHIIADVTGLQVALDAKTNTGHTHTTTDITNLSTYTGFDARYYTESETNTLLNAKASTTHTHTTADITNLSSYTGLDTRYYTESETDTLLNAKANTGHSHIIADVTGLQVALDAKTNTGHSHLTSDITNLSTYTGFDTRYYTESETNTLLNAKASTTHTHLTADITNLSSYTGLDTRYYTESETDTLLNAKANTGHTHTLGQLTDVNLTGLVNGNIIAYNSVSGNFEPISPSTGGSGEINTASNLGAGQGVFVGKVAEDLQFKSLTAGTDISLTSNGTTITINSTASGVTELKLLNDTAAVAVADGYLRWDATGTTVNYVTIAASDVSGLATVATTGSYANLTSIPSTFAPTAHTHIKAEITDFNDADYATAVHTHTTADITNLSSYTGLDTRYYTESETDTLLNAKANTGHSHIIADVTGLQVALDAKTNTGHTHLTADITNLSTYTGFDTRYYTESETNTLLNAKASTTHTHLTADITNLSSYTGFDTRYYTESEVDTFLSNKSGVTHTHTTTDITDLVTTGITNGQVLAYNSVSGNFEPADNAGGGGGGSVATLDDVGDVTYGVPISARYWRLNISASSSGFPFTLIRELHFGDTVGGPNLATGGTAIGTAGTNVNRAFDGNLFNNWDVDPLPGWIGYDFGAGNDIALVEIGIYNNFSFTAAPGDFTVEYSNDGTNWTVLSTFVGKGDYTADSWAYFASGNKTPPAAGETIIYDGTNWANAVVPAGVLTDLTDVGFQVPSENQFLFYKDGYWIQSTSYVTLQTTLNSATMAIQRSTLPATTEGHLIVGDDAGNSTHDGILVVEGPSTPLIRMGVASIPDRLKITTYKNQFGGSATNVLTITQDESYWYDSAGGTNLMCFDFAGRMRVGAFYDEPTAKLAVESTTAGFLPPRMTTTQRDAIVTPAAGLMIYNNVTNQMNYYNGTSWIAF